MFLMMGDVSQADPDGTYLNYGKKLEICHVKQKPYGCTDN